jgi:AcrR family transcriptional regulator
MNASSAHPVATGSRDRLLDAAEELAAVQGATSLTLDAVARAAGVSKGGLLYHFPTKEALLEAMLQRHIDGVDARVASLRDAREDCRHNPVLAQVVALLETLPAKPAVGAALIAASAADPHLMAPCRQHYAALLAELESLPCGFERAATLLLAVDGLVLGELIHLSPFTPEQRRRVVAELERLAVECRRDR